MGTNAKVNHLEPMWIRLQPVGHQEDWRCRDLQQVWETSNVGAAVEDRFTSKAIEDPGHEKGL
ncbi:MAG: hypothetical protein EBZ76_14080, partial [Synechococcaceae bacterium WB9_2_170]|nr:hypothetical protein [Synechococcaceae bacterium WB9_2_170]